MAASASPFLMFEGRAEEALSFYVATLPGGKVHSVVHWETGSPGKPGTVMLATFEIAGLKVMCSDSPVAHKFTFTPSSSLFVTLDTEDDLRRIADALGAGGEVLMPLNNYGFSRLFTWVADRFGVSWQLNLP
jgi:predicted 3-demethylubiquinone-9 3-methyltransferase (glyoxalase superfamily)